MLSVPPPPSTVLQLRSYTPPDWASTTEAANSSRQAASRTPRCRAPGLRQALIAHLRGRGIIAVFHYQPLHLSDMGRRFGGKPGDCPVTEEVSDRLLRLPYYFELTLAEQQRVVDAIASFFG